MTDRESIAAYLAHIASMDVGTVLTPEGRELVGMCAEWVRNRLDEDWHRKRLEQEMAAAKAKLDQLTPDELLAYRRRQFETVKRIRSGL